MVQKARIVVGALVGVVGLCGVALLLQPKDPACVRFESRLGLAKQFCEGLAERASQDKCQSLSDEPETMGQCLRVMRPAAYAGCMDYINLEKMKQEYEALCH